MAKERDVYISVDVLCSITRQLNQYFPNILFYKNDNVLVIEKLDILKCLNEDNNAIDLKLMSKNENYKQVFPDDFLITWNENDVKNSINCFDIIKYYLYINNEKDWSKFSKNPISRYINKNDIPDLFINDFFKYNGEPAYILDELKFPIEHSDKNIYKAFQRYACRNYNLLGFRKTKFNNYLYDFGFIYDEMMRFYKEDIVKENMKKIKILIMNLNQYVNNAVERNYPHMKKNKYLNEIKNFNKTFIIKSNIKQNDYEINIENYINTNWNSTRYIFIQKLLETKFYDFYSFMNDAIGGLKNYNLLNNDPNDNLFTDGDKQTIKEYFKLIAPLINDDVDILQQDGKYYEKIIFIYKKILQKSINCFTQKQLNTIHSLYSKLFIDSLDKQIPENENSNLHDLIGDIRFSPEKINEQRIPFLNTFEKEFKNSKQELNNFVDCIIDYFNKKPKAFKNQISKDHARNITKIFCDIKNIECDDQIIEHIFTLINKAINIIING